MKKSQFTLTNELTGLRAGNFFFVFGRKHTFVKAQQLVRAMGGTEIVYHYDLEGTPILLDLSALLYLIGNSSDETGGTSANQVQP